MAQVKFYSLASLPETPEEGGVYFIQGGELYKGSQRFGLGRVTKASTAEAIAALDGVERGDINIGYQGAKVYDGEAWQPLGGDIPSLESSWRADISTWTAGLSTGDSSSYIAYIEQANDGKVTAHAVAFPDLTFATGDADGQVKLGSTNATVSGWSGLVGKVEGLESIVDVSNSTVAATTGSFTNLTVTSTATFTATEVSASSLTISGSTVEEIADARIGAISEATSSSASNGITVAVTTEAGSVKTVTVNASAFGNVMHFRDVVSNTADVTDPVAGDIVLIGSEADTGFVAGQEYIYTSASTWEVIGDQTTYAANAYSSTATVFTGATTLAGALNAAGSAIDTLNSDVSALSSAIGDFVGGDASSSASGVTVSVGVNASTMAPSVSLAVDAAALATALSLGDAAGKSVANTIDASAATLPTCSAVASYVDNALTWITE